METLFLTRHALAGSNRDGLASCTWPGEGLTDDGVAQARAVGRRLADEEISLGVASRLVRTQETLELALAGRDVPTIVVPELDEIHFGSFDGGLLAEYRAWAATHPPDEPAPGGGESRAQAAARFARGLEIVLARPEREVLLVGHALVLRYVLDAAAGLVPAAVMSPVDHASPYRLGVEEVEEAARVLAEWSADARFRDPPEEGRAGSDAGRRGSE